MVSGGSNFDAEETAKAVISSRRVLERRRRVLGRMAKDGHERATRLTAADCLATGLVEVDVSGLQG